MYPYLLVVSWNFVPANERIEREGESEEKVQKDNKIHITITFYFDIKLCILHALPAT